MRDPVLATDGTQTHTLDAVLQDGSVTASDGGTWCRSAARTAGAVSQRHGTLRIAQNSASTAFVAADGMILPLCPCRCAGRDGAQGFLHPADNRRMEPHFHAWLRTGRVYTMVGRPYAVASTAHRYAEKLRPDKGDRLVLGCTECPPTRPSKRRPPRWATVARQVAAAVGAEPAAVRRALATALAAERER